MLATLTAISCAAQKKDTLAEKLLLYQLPNGGWGKQLEGKAVDYSIAVDKNMLDKIKASGDEHATIDNSATTKEINLLINAYAQTKCSTRTVDSRSIFPTKASTESRLPIMIMP